MCHDFRCVRTYVGDNLKQDVPAYVNAQLESEAIQTSVCLVIAVFNFLACRLQACWAQSRCLLDPYVRVRMPLVGRLRRCIWGSGWEFAHPRANRSYILPFRATRQRF